MLSDESDEDDDRHQGRRRVVRMVAPEERPLAETGSTLLAAVLSTGSAPKFSGEEADWETFSYDWRTYVEILRQAEGGRLKDVHLFEMLRRSVDVATQNRLRAESRLDPTLTYAQFWQSLDREFTRDHEGARRRDWEAVRLAKGELTLRGWREYRATFEMALIWC